jgi:hypothetical protein
VIVETACLSRNVLGGSLNDDHITILKSCTIIKRVEKISRQNNTREIGWLNANNKSQPVLSLLIPSGADGTILTGKSGEHQGAGQQTGERVESEDVCALRRRDDRGLVLDGAHRDAEVVGGEHEAEDQEAEQRDAEGYAGQTTMPVELGAVEERTERQEVQTEKAAADVAGDLRVRTGVVLVAHGDAADGQEAGAVVRQQAEHQQCDAGESHDGG